MAPKPPLLLRALAAVFDPRGVLSPRAFGWRTLVLTLAAPAAYTAFAFVAPVMTRELSRQAAVLFAGAILLTWITAVGCVRRLRDAAAGPIPHFVLAVLVLGTLAVNAGGYRIWANAQELEILLAPLIDIALIPFWLVYGLALAWMPTRSARRPSRLKQLS